MKILFFDTETGGLNEFDNDILQLSYQIYDTETQQTLKEVDSFFPWPADKSRVQQSAIQVNGLTEEYLATKTMADRHDAMSLFFADMAASDYVVAHNGAFDKRFIMATSHREGVPYAIWKPMIDTMMTTIDLCQLPPHPGRTGFKYPKLIELGEFLQVQTDDLNLHDSSADVELTKRCFLKLLEMGHYKL